MSSESKAQLHQDDHEPLSGVKGQGTPQQPFAQGNDEGIFSRLLYGCSDGK